MINLISKIDKSNYILSEVDGVFTLKNENKLPN